MHAGKLGATLGPVKMEDPSIQDESALRGDGSKALDDVGEYLYNILSSSDLSVRYISWKY